MPPVRLTARDQHLAAWIGRWQPVTAMQVAARFEIARAIAYRRLKALTTLGYLRHVRRVHELPGVYILTELGHDLTGIEPSTSSLRSPRALWGWLAAIDATVPLEVAGLDCVPSPELSAHLPLRPRVPQLDEEPVFPEVLALDGAAAIALYGAIGPGGVLDGPVARLLSLLAGSERPPGTEVRVLAAHEAVDRVRAAAAEGTVVCALDPEHIGTPAPAAAG
jgi:hypothetical protein